ncbi:MAG: carboxypeptidase-like regulatory domain-containing protein [Flavobacteriales bacterium]|nr:carboxypeptidase-like regulatory domain-containing protein [Flavobacteriales bacterium]
MKTTAFRLSLSLFLLTLAAPLLAQVTSQTIRGTVLDQDTRQPLYGAAIVVVGSQPLLAATADEEGRFVIPKVPTGRIDLVIQMMGFEEQKLSNLLLTSGRELVVNVNLLSSVVMGQEVTVHGDRKREDLRNDMVSVSGRKIGVEETSRIAGGINDPARMVSAFPGVAGDATGDNTIIARGNSSKGVLWRLEGMEIPNPNHFSEEGSTGGPINVLNSDMLDDSEFYTGAFAPEYGNALSAVFDMKLRDGNDTEREYTLKAGVLGTDLTAEGPMPGLRGGSYLANFRYSTLSLLDQAGIVDYQGVPNYTDGAFKLKLPAGRAGSFSLFGLGGQSTIHQEERSEVGDTLFAENDYRSRMGVVGLTHLRTLGENSYIQSSLSVSGNGSDFDYHQTDAPGEVPLALREQSALGKWTTRFSSTLNNRLNSKHKLRSGIIVSVDQYQMLVDSWSDEANRMERQLEAHGEATTLQAFSSWRWRWNEQWTMTSGVHVLHFALNGATNVEPRLGLRYQMKPGRAITAGAGLHAKTESVMTYLAQGMDAEGNTYQPNKNLGLSKAAHFVVGYEHMLTEDIQVKAEAYYQHHFNVPVENDPASSFTLSNSTEWFTTKDHGERRAGPQLRARSGRGEVLHAWLSLPGHGLLERCAQQGDGWRVAQLTLQHGHRGERARGQGMAARQERQGPCAHHRIPVLDPGRTICHAHRPRSQPPGRNASGWQPRVEREGRCRSQTGRSVGLPRRATQGEPRDQGRCAERAEQPDSGLPLLRQPQRYDQGCAAAGDAAGVAVHVAVLRTTNAEGRR